MARFAIFFALFAFAAVSATDIKFADGSGDKTVLLSYGDAACSVSVLYKGPVAEPIVSTSDLYDIGPISSTDAPNGYVNYTIPFTFAADVGSEDYTISIREVSVTARLTVAGFVIKQDGVIVSGDDGPGVTVGQDGTSTYDVKVVGTDGSELDISGTKIEPKAVSGTYMKEVDTERTSITEDTFTLAISEYRVGSGSFLIMFETPAIEYMGEVFETVLSVKQTTTPAPPCVAIGGAISAVDGYVMVPMFNLLSPPLASPVETVVITVGSETAEWDTSKSTLSLPDQVIAFPISSSGTASITCDGQDAVILGGDIDVSGDGSAVELATELIAALPSSDTQATFNARISITDSSPETLTKAACQPILDKFCGFMSTSSACVLEDLVAGSAVMEVASLIDEDAAEGNTADLEECFAEPACTCQSELGYTCESLKLLGSNVNAVVGGVGGASAGGLATWTIVLIACVGAFALILVIVLGLWAVYRRSAEQSESDYSSSGPLGVPDPSDLLYEQSIVRDIYGRGDFPDGGPSQAVAEQRAREADLREEFPRPPSSSGLSRGAATDDASSTYSV